MHSSDYITKSLELHLFFGRIMKEHSLFLEAGYTPVNSDFGARAEHYKNEFERLLNKAVTLADGIISENVLASGEIVTEFTKAAERQTEKLTGIHIDSGITDRELRLSCCSPTVRPDMYIRVKSLNIIALRLLNGLISLKEETLEQVKSCQMFTMNYPLLIEHIIREAKLYRQYIRNLEESGTVGVQSMKEVECFWNQIMMEHAMFIRGLLDPSEAELIKSADGFAKDYLHSCKAAIMRRIWLSGRSRKPRR